MRALAAGLLCLWLAACAGPGKRGPAMSNPDIDPAQRTEVIMTALSLLDTRYRYGGSQAQQGFDCSGLVKYVFGTATGTTLPHSTEQIARMSRPVPRRELRAG
ncbi:MAG: C40 family peptidase, partial [Castellaniella sp.]